MEEKVRKLTRRDFLRLGGMAIGAVVVARCSPAEPSTGGDPGAEAVELTFFAWGTDAEIGAWQTLAGMYKDQNPNVTVAVNPGSTGDEFYQKLQTTIAGGTTPNISGFQGWEWQPYADNGLLAALDDYVQASDVEKIYPEGIKSVVDSTIRNGNRYLVPMQTGTMLMFYAKQPFDEAGIPYPTSDWTFEEFLEIAEKLTTGGKFGLQVNGSWFRDIHHIRSTGTQEFDSISDPKKAQFNQPEIVDIIQLVAQDMVYKMGIAPSAADMEGGANQFQSGGTAMKYEGPWWFPNMSTPELREEGKDIPFDVVLMPKYKDATRPHRGWSEGVCVMKGDQEQAAWEFCRFMATGEGNRTYSEITGRIPADISVIDSFWIPTIKERFGVENGQAFLEAFKLSEVDVIGGVPRSKMNAEVVSPIGYDPLVNNSATAAEVLPKVDEALQAMLDEYWASQ